MKLLILTSIIFASLSLEAFAQSRAKWHEELSQYAECDSAWGFIAYTDPRHPQVLDGTKACAAVNILDRIFDQNARRFAWCFDRVLLAYPEFAKKEERIPVTFKVQEGHVVSLPKGRPDSTGHSFLRDCLEGQIQSIQMPKDMDGLVFTGAIKFHQ
jgi:hypothetical protein